MKVVRNNKTIAATLNDLIVATFPLARNTGKANDLISVHIDKDSKGKAVTFTWKKTTLKLTENLKVKELDFTNTYTETELSKEAEILISTHIA